MKQIIVATAITSVLLICGASAAQAQQAAPTRTTPAPLPTASTDPRLDVTKMAPNQREYIFNAVMAEQSGLSPDMLQKFKDRYKNMSPEMQTHLAGQMAGSLDSMPEIKEKIIKGIPEAPAPTPAPQK